MKLDKNVVIDQKNLDLFWYWIAERQKIWHNRFEKKNPAPWTEDWILKEFKFTNCYRELDRGTIYLIDEILSKGKLGDVRSIKDVVFNVIIYRLFNNLDTHKAIGFQKLDNLNVDRDIGDILRKRKKSGKIIFTNAHMLPGNKMKNIVALTKDPDDKLENWLAAIKIVHSNFNSIYKSIVESKSLENLCQFLKTLPYIGPFLSYEIGVDLMYPNVYYDYSIVPFTEDDWANPGPGCQRGINRIFKNRGSMSFLDVIKYLRSIQVGEFERLDLNMPYHNGKELTLRNIEHSLCEFSKYMKAYLGEGRPRNKYTPYPGFKA